MSSNWTPGWPRFYPPETWPPAFLHNDHLHAPMECPKFQIPAPLSTYCPFLIPSIPESSASKKHTSDTCNHIPLPLYQTSTQLSVGIAPMAVEVLSPSFSTRLCPTSPSPLTAKSKQLLQCYPNFLEMYRYQNLNRYRYRYWILNHNRYWYWTDTDIWIFQF